MLFDFNDTNAELKGKQIKTQTLHELLEYITTQRGAITESIYPEVVKMVSALRFLTVESVALSSARVIRTVCDKPLPFDTPSC